MPVGIVHLGVGAFHRAHQAVYIDDLLAVEPQWGICGVSLHSSAVRDALAPQDGLYTLTLLQQVGVTMSADIAAHDRAKLRLLSGAHSTLAYVACCLAGKRWPRR